MSELDKKITISEKIEEDIEILNKATDIIENIVGNHIPSFDMIEALHFLEDIQIETEQEIKQEIFLQTLKSNS